MYLELQECIIDRSPLTLVCNFGSRLGNSFMLMKCDSCSLVQMRYTSKLSSKYVTDKESLLAIVQKARRYIDLAEGEKVLDIGCGDGTLLGWYEKGIVTFGVDTNPDLIKKGMSDKNIDIGIADYFTYKNVCVISKLMNIPEPKFKIITAVDVFDRTTDPVQFLKDCKELLHREGAVVIQLKYLVDLLGTKTFDSKDQIAFYSVLTLAKVITQAGLAFEGLEFSKANGGSLRAYITHPEFQYFAKINYSEKLWLNTNCYMKMTEEMRMGLDKFALYKRYEDAVNSNKSTVEKEASV